MDYVSLMATINAMCAVWGVADPIIRGKIFDRTYQRNLKTFNEAELGLLQQALSTYSDEEVLAINRRLENCRKTFISEGDGEQRATCFCNVLNNVREGNGGEIPDIGNWRRTHGQLCPPKA